MVKAGKLSAVASGPKAAFEIAKPYMLSFAPRGVSYVGEGELSRICKIAHNVMLGVVIQNLAEITILAQKAGVPRHAFLDFMNNGVMGSIFTRYKSNAFVNLDWTTTFTPELLRKDLDLGLEAARGLDVPMPVTAATREALQAHFGAAHAASRSAGLPGEGFRRHARDRCARRRHQAQERERGRSHGARGAELTSRDIAGSEAAAAAERPKLAAHRAGLLHSRESR